jgi:hypothetical protein
LEQDRADHGADQSGDGNPGRARASGEEVRSNPGAEEGARDKTHERQDLNGEPAGGAVRGGGCNEDDDEQVDEAQGRSDPITTQ